MLDQQAKFIHIENIKNFTLKLAVETDIGRREMLTQLLGEEMGKFPLTLERE